jgi:hypothetical protein
MNINLAIKTPKEKEEWKNKEKSYDYGIKCCYLKYILSRAWWLKPIILATQEALKFETSQGKKFGDPLSTNAKAWWHTPVIPNYEGKHK